MKSETINTIEKYMIVPRAKSRMKQNDINVSEKLVNRLRTRSAVKTEMPYIKVEPTTGLTGIQPEPINQMPNRIQKVTKELEGPRTRASVKQEQDETYLKHALHDKLPAIPQRTWRVKRFCCSICDEKFKSAQMRLDHEREVHNNEIKITIDLLNYYCDFCQRNYNCIGGYRKHMQCVHGMVVSPASRRPKRDTTKIPDLKDPNNHCISCKHTYSSGKDYRTHLKKIHNIVPGIEIKDQAADPPVYSPDNRCITCDRKFSSKVTYRRHLKQFHKMNLPELNSDPSNFDEERLFCRVCETTYKTYDTFRAHIRVTHRAPLLTLIQHPDVKPDINDPNLFCATCDKTYKRKDSYIHHLAQHHTDVLPELYIGKRVDKVRKANLVYNQYCSKCRCVFLSKSLYRMHLKRIHSTKLVNTKPNPKDPNNHCAPCNKTYSHKSVYRTHLLNLHSMDLEPLTIGLKIKDKIPTVDNVNYYCNVCDKTYTQKFYYIHLLRVHGLDAAPARLGHNDVNRFQKPVIDRENPYCSACEKVYKNKGAFRGHLVRVHGIRLPRLASKPLNTNHDIIPDINDAKSYCASCDRTFVNPGSYRLHLANIHKMRIRRVKQEGSDELLNVLIEEETSTS